MQNGGMDTSSGTYTAKLIDGLEGKTVSTGFLDTGDRSRGSSSTRDEGKHYVYSPRRGPRVRDDDDDRPTAVEYRFIETVFD